MTVGQLLQSKISNVQSIYQARIDSLNLQRFDSIFAQVKAAQSTQSDTLLSAENVVVDDAQETAPQSAKLPWSPVTVYIEPASALSSDAKVTGDAAARMAQYEELIEKAAIQYGLEVSLVKGIMMTESAFKADVTSHAGAQGLMQLMPATAQSLGVTDPFDPAQNIDAGVRYLRKKIDQYDGDIKMGLAAYNCGSGRLAELGVTTSSDPDIFGRLSDGVLTYVSRVLSYAEGFKKS